MCRMREDNLNFCGACAGMGNQKLQPFSGKEWHVTAEYEIPFGGASGRDSMLQRGDNTAEGPLAGPAIFNDLQFTVQASVFLRAGDNGNFGSASLRQLDDFQQQRSGAKADEGLVATKARTRAASKNVGAYI